MGEPEWIAQAAEEIYEADYVDDVQHESSWWRSWFGSLGCCSAGARESPAVGGAVATQPMLTTLVRPATGPDAARAWLASQNFEPYEVAAVEELFNADPCATSLVFLLVLAC